MNEIPDEKCDVCGAVLHWSPLVEGLPKMSMVSDCRHVVRLDDAEISGEPCPRCSLGKNIFRGSCIVCDGLNDHIAGLLKDMVGRIAQLQADRDALDLKIAEYKAVAGEYRETHPVDCKCLPCLDYADALSNANTSVIEVEETKTKCKN